VAFDQGIDFRSTAGFVTDPTGCDKETATTANYPRTSAQGNTVGWEDAISGVANRSAAVDARLAGIAFAANGTPKRYRLDLPSSGWYRITLAIGDQTTAQSQSVGIYDGTTLVSNVVGHNLASAGGTFYDACGVRRSSAANWVANEVTVVAFFSSTICRIKIADTATASGNSTIAHVRVTDASAPSPSFNCGIDFRATSAFVTDPTNCSPQINNFADYPHINAQGIVCGWEDAPSTVADRSAAADARLAGIGSVAAGGTARFRIDLPAAGAYRIEAAVGDATTAQPASGGSPAQRVEVFDGLSSLGLLVNNRQTLAAHWRDATDTDRTSSANWVSNEAPSTWSFSGTTLRFKCGITAGGAGSTTLSHLKVTQLTGIAGTSSLSAAINRIRRFLATLAGTSTLSATLIKKLVSASIAGTSSLSASINRFRSPSATIAGTSSLTAALINRAVAATIAGTSALTAALNRTRSFAANITGAGTLTAALANKIFAGNIAGTSSLSATVSTGGTVKNFTATISGTSSLRAALPYRVPSGSMTLDADAPTVYPYYASLAQFVLDADSPTSTTTTPIPSGVIRLAADPPSLPAMFQPFSGAITLRGDPPRIVTSQQPISGQLRLTGDPPTVYPTQTPTGILSLKATGPGGVPTTGIPGRILLRGDQQTVYPIQVPSGVISLKADGPEMASSAIRLKTSGVILLRADTPIVTPLTEPPPPPPPPPPGTGISVSGNG
jgi:hypothetical protein